MEVVQPTYSNSQVLAPSISTFNHSMNAGSYNYGISSSGGNTSSFHMFDKSDRFDDRLPESARSTTRIASVTSAWADHQRAMLEATAESLASLEITSAASSPRANKGISKGAFADVSDSLVSKEGLKEPAPVANILVAVSESLSSTLPVEAVIEKSPNLSVAAVPTIEVSEPLVPSVVEDEDFVLVVPPPIPTESTDSVPSDSASNDVIDLAVPPFLETAQAVEPVVDSESFRTSGLNSLTDLLDSDLNLNGLNLEFEGAGFLTKEEGFSDLSFNDNLLAGPAANLSMLNSMGLGNIISNYGPTGEDSGNTGLNSITFNGIGGMLGGSSQSSPRPNEGLNTLGSLTYSNPGTDRYFMDTLAGSDPLHMSLGGFNSNSLNLDAINDYNLEADVNSSMSYLFGSSMLGQSDLHLGGRGFGFNNAHDSILNGKDLVDDSPLLTDFLNVGMKHQPQQLHHQQQQQQPGGTYRPNNRGFLGDRRPEDGELGGFFSALPGLQSFPSHQQPVMPQPRQQYLGDVLGHLHSNHLPDSNLGYPYSYPSSSSAASSSSSSSNSFAAVAATRSQSGSRGLNMPGGGSLGAVTGFTRPTTASPSMLLSHSPPPSLAMPPSSGIDSDLLPEMKFPSVAWLRQLGMHMYQWAGDNKEWTEYAMHVPAPYTQVFLGPDPIVKLQDLSRMSGCEMWAEEEMLEGRSEKFIVLRRGYNGDPANVAMNHALEFISTSMNQYITKFSPGVGLLKPTSMTFKSPSSPSLIGFPALSGSIPPTVDNSTKAGTSSWQSIVSSSGKVAPNAAAVPVAAPPASSNLTSTALNPLLDPLSTDYLDPNSTAHLEALLADSTAIHSGSTPKGSEAANVPRGPRKDRPELLRVAATPSGYVQRSLEIPREVVGLIIGQAGKKIKELCSDSGAKIQFRVNKTAEREGRPGLLEVQGSRENVEQGMQLIWDLLQLLGKEYVEVPYSGPQATVGGGPGQGQTTTRKNG